MSATMMLEPESERTLKWEYYRKGDLSLGNNRVLFTIDVPAKGVAPLKKLLDKLVDDVNMTSRVLQLLREDDAKKERSRLLKKITDKLTAMPKEEFDAFLEEHKDGAFSELARMMGY